MRRELALHLRTTGPFRTPRDTMRRHVLVPCGQVAERAARRELARSARDDDGGLGGFIPGGGRGGEDDLLGGGDSFEAAKAR